MYIYISQTFLFLVTWLYSCCCKYVVK